MSIFLWIRLSTYLELLCLLYNVIWRQNFHLFGVNQTLGKDKYRTYWCTVEKIPTKYLDHFVVHKIELSLKKTQNKIPRHLSSINIFISHFYPSCKVSPEIIEFYNVIEGGGGRNSSKKILTGGWGKGGGQSRAYQHQFPF